MLNIAGPEKESILVIDRLKMYYLLNRLRKGSKLVWYQIEIPQYKPRLAKWTSHLNKTSPSKAVTYDLQNNNNNR